MSQNIINTWNKTPQIDITAWFSAIQPVFSKPTQITQSTPQMQWILQKKMPEGRIDLQERIIQTDNSQQAMQWQSMTNMTPTQLLASQRLQEKQFDMSKIDNVAQLTIDSYLWWDDLWLSKEELAEYYMFKNPDDYSVYSINYDPSLEPQAWWTRGIANQMNQWRWAFEWINPIWKWAEEIDDVVQSLLPTFSLREMDAELERRVDFMDQDKANQYIEKFNSLPQWKQNLYGNAKNYAKDQEMTFKEKMLGVWESGIRVPTMIANIIPSWIKNASSVGRAILNPYDTIESLYMLTTTEEGQELIRQRYWSMDAFSRTVEEDPVWVASDLMSLYWLWASGVWKAAWLAWKALWTTSKVGRALTSAAPKLLAEWAAVSSAADFWIDVWIGNLRWWLSDFAKSATTPVGKVAWTVAEAVKLQTELWWVAKNIPLGEIAKVPIKFLWWIKEEQIKQVVENPDIDKKIVAWEITQDTVIDDIKKSYESLQKEVSDLWGVYKRLWWNEVKVDPQNVNNRLVDKWFDLVIWDDGNVVSATFNKNYDLTPSEVGLINKLADKWTTDVSDMMNLRSTIWWEYNKLSDKFNKKGSIDAMRNVVWDILKEQVPEISRADKEFSPLRKDLQNFEDNFVNKKTWDIKYSAIENSIKSPWKDNAFKFVETVNKDIPWQIKGLIARKVSSNRLFLWQLITAIASWGALEYWVSSVPALISGAIIGWLVNSPWTALTILRYIGEEGKKSPDKISQSDVENAFKKAIKDDSWQWEEVIWSIMSLIDEKTAKDILATLQ